MTYSHLFTPTRRGLHRAGALGAAHVGHNYIKGSAHGKTKFKHSRSMTSTKKEEKMHGDDIHSGITETGYRVVVNPKVPKNVDRGIAWQYLEGATKVLQGSPGLQKVGTISMMGTTGQHMYVANTVTTDPGNDPSTSSTAYLKLNPNTATTGGSLWGVVGAPATTKYLYSHAGVTIRLANFATLACEVEIIMLKAKTNTNDFPEDLWTECAANHALGRFGAATLSGGGSTTTGTLGYAQAIFPDASPFAYKEFKKFWTPLKFHNVNLAAGASEKVHFNVKMNQKADIAKFINLNAGFTTDPVTWTGANSTIRFPTGSVAFMVVQRGALAKDVTAPTAPPQGCCVPGQTEVGYYITKHSYFQTIAKTSQQLDTEVAVYSTSNPIVANTRAINVLDVVSATVIS